MTEQGFTDGDYVIGEERIDTSLSEFSRQGSLGFRQGDTLPETREQLAELFASTDENVKLAIDAQVRKFPDIGQETLLDVNNWEIVQTTVTSVVQGNSGLSGNVQVSVGDTTSEAGDAAWVFIDTTSCEVARSYITATGVELPADTDKSDLPVAALRPGCINPTDGFKPVPPPEPEPEPTCPPNTTPWPECNDLKWVEDSPTEEGWDQRGTDNGLTDGQQSAEQIVSGETRGNAVDDQVADTPATNTGGTTKDTVPSDQGGPVAENATSGGDDQQHGAVDPENTNRDSGGVEGDTCVPDVITGITC